MGFSSPHPCKEVGFRRWQQPTPSPRNWSQAIASRSSPRTSASTLPEFLQANPDRPRHPGRSRRAAAAVPARCVFDLAADAGPRPAGACSQRRPLAGVPGCWPLSSARRKKAAARLFSHADLERSTYRLRSGRGVCFPRRRPPCQPRRVRAGPASGSTEQSRRLRPAHLPAAGPRHGTTGLPGAHRQDRVATLSRPGPVVR